jgi:predicted aspartyl protease
VKPSREDTQLNHSSLSRRGIVAGGLAGLGLADPFARALAQVAPAEGPAVIPGAAVAPADESAEVDLAIGEDRIRRLTAPVMINGQGPFDFMVDTGSNRSVISASLAARLNLPKGRPLRVYTTAGSSEFPSVLTDTLQVGDRVMRRANVPVLSAAGLRGDGILGVDWLKGERLILDLLNERLEIRKPGRAPMSSGATVVPARLRSGQLTIIDADLNGRGRISCLIDSGSEVSMGNQLLRELAHRDNPSFEKDLQPITMVDAANRAFEAQYGFLPFVRIGGVQFGNLPVAFADTPLLRLWGLERSPAIMLGMDIIRQFARVEMDFSQSRVGFTVLEARA